MIKELKLRNWKSHLESDFQFDEGTNVLVGIMGSGKSSVLSATSFALFGTFPALRSREITLDEVIMARPQRKEEAEVELTFELGDDEFTVKRVIERGKGTSEANIRKNGEMLDSGASRTTELVEKYLKVDYELFSRAVYSEQDGLDYFLEIRKGQRMKHIDNLLRIDRFEDCRSNVTTLINRISDKIESQTEIVNKMEEKEDFGKIDELKGEINEINESIEKYKKKLKRNRKKYKDVKKSIEDIKEGIEDIKELENKKSSLEGVISSVKSDVKDLKSEVELSMDRLEEELEEKRKGIERKEEEMNSLEDELEGLKEESQGKKVKIQELQEKIQKLKSVEGKCPVCDSELTDKHKEELLKKRRERMQDLSEEKEEISEEIEELEEEIEEKEEVIEELEEEKRSLEKSLEKAEELERKEEKLEEKREQIEEVEEELEEKREKYDKEEVEKKQEKLEELSAEKSEIKTEIESKNKFLEDKEERLKELEEKKEAFRRYKEEIERSKELNGDLKKFRNALKSTQEKLRKRFIEAVNNTLRRIWDDLYPYNDFGSIRLTIKEGDYELQFKSSGSWQSVEGIASGGERTSACLALRVAFALVLAPNLKWLVLDEPTHNLDSRAIEDLSELLRTKVSELVDQVFLITHEEGMKSAANAYLYELDREKENNEPTKVKEINQEFT